MVETKREQEGYLAHLGGSITIHYNSVLARRRFFVDHISGGAAELLGDEARHLTRVLRVEPGQRFEISDNRAAFLAEVTEARGERVTFRVIEPVDSAAPPVHIALIAAIVKFDRFEWAVEKATELGVTRIVPVAAARSERGLFEGGQKRAERWRRDPAKDEEMGHCVALFWDVSGRGGAFSKSSFVGLGHREAVHPDETSVATSYAQAYVAMQFTPLYFGVSQLEEVAHDLDWRFHTGDLNEISERLQATYEYGFAVE